MAVMTPEEQERTRVEEIVATVTSSELHLLAHVAQYELRQRATTALEQVHHPSWCGRDEACQQEDTSGHPVDWLHRHESDAVDSWTPDNGDHAIDVYVWGARHPNPALDWPDEIWATNINPGCQGGLALQVPDARRLARALLAACDLADTDSAGRDS